MIDDFANDWIKQFNVGHLYQVSGKTVTVRMYVFLTTIMPAIYDSVEDEETRILAIYRAHKLDAGLLKAAIREKTPENTVLTYIEKINVWCYDIIQKDIGTWIENT